MTPTDWKMVLVIAIGSFIGNLVIWLIKALINRIETELYLKEREKMISMVMEKLDAEEKRKKEQENIDKDIFG